jgi:hypothetical protein
MPEARKRPPVVPTKMKIVVIELLTQSKYDLAAAAEKAGVSHYLARRYLTRSTVRRYFHEQRAAVIEEICAGNPAALAKVREGARNEMAVVAACRQLELMRLAVAEESGGVTRHAPGLVVQIINSEGRVTQTLGPHPAPPIIEYAPAPQSAAVVPRSADHDSRS